ncbi:HEPN domain-containing protein [Asticcacaulis taihuensis]|uniref:HEPN domain-containing protein n=1 Tax=Asticcacaulis taihuensis TaxID=260084 RepID=UPI003F7C7D46
MDALDRAKSTAFSGISEIEDNLKIRKSFSNFFVSRAGEIFNYADMDKDLNKELAAILRLNETDPSPAYRGFIIQLNGIFELFVKQLISATLEHKKGQAARYSLLQDNLRNAHAMHSGAILSKIRDGSINGLRYDFDRLQKNLGTCFSDNENYTLNYDVFTLTIGNMTEDRIKKVFQSVGLTEPFDDELGKNPAIKAWGKARGARESINLAKGELARQIEWRNEIAHGLGTSSINPTDVETTIEFFRALIIAFTDKARTVIPSQ